MAQVSIISVDVEVKKPGARGWSMATVTYNDNGEVKRQNVTSFANKQVFADVQKLIGETVDVEVGQNEKGYPEWKRISPAGGGNTGGYPSNSTPSTPAVQPTRVSGSNYETAVERARRQVLIVRQSSLSNAIEALGPNQEQEAYLSLAEVFADWVFETNDQEDGPTA